MRNMGSRYYKAFRELKPSKEALQRELRIDDDEWQILGNLEEKPATEAELTANHIGSEGHYYWVLRGLVAKGYITKREDASGLNVEYAVTELGSKQLATLGERFGTMVKHRLSRLNPFELHQMMAQIIAYTSPNGVFAEPPRRRFH